MNVKQIGELSQESCSPTNYPFPPEFRSFQEFKYKHKLSTYTQDKERTTMLRIKYKIINNKSGKRIKLQTKKVETEKIDRFKYFIKIKQA